MSYIYNLKHVQMKQIHFHCECLTVTQIYTFCKEKSKAEINFCVNQHDATNDVDWALTIIEPEIFIKMSKYMFMMFNNKKTF